jgi:hypothetical protein
MWEHTIGFFMPPLDNPFNPIHELRLLAAEKWRDLNPERSFQAYTLLEDILAGTASIPVEPNPLKNLANFLKVEPFFLARLQKTFERHGGKAVKKKRPKVNNLPNPGKQNGGVAR